jgi:hypothetical protein
MAFTTRTWLFRVQPYYKDPNTGRLTTSTDKTFETSVTNTDLGPQRAQRMLEAQWGTGGRVDVTCLGEAK